MSKSKTTPVATIDPARIQWRVGATFNGRGGKLMGQLLAYIDARTAMEQLDAKYPGWQYDATPVGAGPNGQVLAVQGRLTCNVNGVVVTRTDVGVAEVDDMAPTKTAYSDALKRTAVHFDIGRELYEMPFVAVQVEDKGERNGKRKAGKPLALPTLNDKGLWEIDPALGYVRYSQVADDEPAPAAAEAKPKQTQAQSSDAYNEHGVTNAQFRGVMARARTAGMDPSDPEGKAALQQFVFDTVQRRSTKDLTPGDIDALYKALEEKAILSATSGELVAAG